MERSQTLKLQKQKLTSKELFDLKIVDEIIKEPIGGAHRDKEITLENIRLSIIKNLKEFENLSEDEIVLQRKINFYKLVEEEVSTQPDTTNSLS